MVTYSWCEHDKATIYCNHVPVSGDMKSVKVSLLETYPHCHKSSSFQVAVVAAVACHQAISQGRQPGAVQDRHCQEDCVRRSPFGRGHLGEGEGGKVQSHCGQGGGRTENVSIGRCRRKAGKGDDDATHVNASQMNRWNLERERVELPLPLASQEL
jgi:hypothetical protein